MNLNINISLSSKLIIAQLAEVKTNLDLRGIPVNIIAEVVTYIISEDDWEVIITPHGLMVKIERSKLMKLTSLEELKSSLIKLTWIKLALANSNIERHRLNQTSFIPFTYIYILTGYKYILYKEIDRLLNKLTHISLKAALDGISFYSKLIKSLISFNQLTKSKVSFIGFSNSLKVGWYLKLYSLGLKLVSFSGKPKANFKLSRETTLEIEKSKKSKANRISYKEDSMEVTLYLKNKISSYRASINSVAHFPNDWNRTGCMAAKHLLTSIRIEKIKEAIDWFFGDDFWKDKIDSMWGISKHFNKFTASGSASTSDLENLINSKMI